MCGDRDRIMLYSVSVFVQVKRLVVDWFENTAVTLFSRQHTKKIDSKLVLPTPAKSIKKQKACKLNLAQTKQSSQSKKVNEPQEGNGTFKGE
jgi:hypothetical protein